MVDEIGECSRKIKESAELSSHYRIKGEAPLGNWRLPMLIWILIGNTEMLNRIDRQIKSFSDSLLSPMNQLLDGRGLFPMLNDTTQIS